MSWLERPKEVCPSPSTRTQANHEVVSFVQKHRNPFKEYVQQSGQNLAQK